MDLDSFARNVLGGNVADDSAEWQHENVAAPPDIPLVGFVPGLGAGIVNPDIDKDL